MGGRKTNPYKTMQRMAWDGDLLLFWARKPTPFTDDKVEESLTELVIRIYKGAFSDIEANTNDKLTKNEFYHFQDSQKMSLTIWSRFCIGVAMGVSLDLWGQNFCRVGSLGSARTSGFQRQVRFWRLFI